MVIEAHMSLRHRSLLLIPLLASAVLIPVQGRGPVKVRGSKVLEMVFAPTIHVLGELQAIRRAKISAEVDGLVKEVLVDAGSRVKLGQVLLRQKTVQREIRRRRAMAELELAKKQHEEFVAGSRPEVIREAQAALAEAVARLAEAETELERVRGLRKRDVASDKELSTAIANARTASATLDRRTASLDRIKKGPRAEVLARAKSQVQIRQTELDEVLDEIEKAEVKAPFAGMISAKHTEVGNYIRRGDAEFSLVQMNPIYVVVAVPEQAIASVRKGQKAQVVLNAVAGTVFEAVVAAIVPDGDPLSRNFPVKLLLENEDFRLLPGMAARASLKLERAFASLAVPSDALLRSPRGPIVYVVRDGKSVRVNVKVLQTQGSLIEVTGDLHKGELVVTHGNEGLRDGALVELLANPVKNDPSKKGAGNSK